VHRISHTLHPALLQQLGLVPAIREFCQEIKRARALKIEFTHVPLEPPDDIALCLFRVTQESLQNVAKHSGSSAAKVDLAMDENDICLSIFDSGEGFDPDSQKVRDSLGLVSMRERIRAVGGSLTVDSNPGAGTRIVAKVPLS
jgi:signal transduction histidine kinase